MRSGISGLSSSRRRIRRAAHAEASGASRRGDDGRAGVCGPPPPRGRPTPAWRTAVSEVRVIGGPLNFGLFGVSTVAAQGANSRTYLAPWRTVAPGVPRAPNMGSFLDINFQDNGTRLNAVSETSADTVTL